VTGLTTNISVMGAYGRARLAERKHADSQIPAARVLVDAQTILDFRCRQFPQPGRNLVRQLSSRSIQDACTFARARLKIDRLGLALQIRANPMRDVIDRRVTNSANWLDVARDRAPRCQMKAIPANPNDELGDARDRT
jgi:hypothetical protein